VCIINDAADEKETKREERIERTTKDVKQNYRNTRGNVGQQTVSVKKNYKVGRVEESVTALNKKPPKKIKINKMCGEKDRRDREMI
jgi:hypothetical protein